MRSGGPKSGFPPSRGYIPSASAPVDGVAGWGYRRFGEGRELPSPRRVQGTYYTLMLGNTLAASFIWGINTLFLLDAGLTNLEAFAANAFFTAGMVIFEIPTGVVADTVGRRVVVPARHGHARRDDRRCTGCCG